MSNVNDAAALLPTFLERLGAMDFDGVRALLHEDAVFETPFRATPSTSSGREEVIERLRASMTGLFEQVAFTIQAVRPGRDPAVAVAEYTSAGLLKSGAPYANRYVGVMEMRDGRVTLFREYFNPLLIPGR